MGKLFADLSYNNKTLVPVGAPIKELTALYKEKNDNYDYAIDTLNKGKAGLDAIPVASGAGEEADRRLLNEAKQYFTNTFDSFGADLENKTPNIKKLVADLDGKFGLKDIQRVAMEQAQYEKELKDRYVKGDINDYFYTNALNYSRKNYQGLKKDAESGKYTGAYNGRAVMNTIDISEKVMKLLDNWKPSETPLYFKGQRIVQDPSGSGYMLYGSQKGVSAAELTEAAKSYISSNSDIQKQLDETIFYEVNNKGEITNKDIKNLIPNASPALRNLFGVKTQKDFKNLKEEDINKILEANNLDAEMAYRALRKDELINESIKLGVSKESFVEYKQNFLRPLDAENPNEYTTKMPNLGVLDPIETSQEFTKKDTEVVATIYNNNVSNLKEAEKRLNILKETKKINPSNVNDQDIKLAEQQIQKLKLEKQLIESRVADLYNINEKDIKDITKIGNPATYSYTPSYVPKSTTNTAKDVALSTTKLNASEHTLKKLILQATVNPLNSKDILQYVDFSENKYLTNYINKQVTDRDIQKVVSNNVAKMQPLFKEQDLSTNGKIDYGKIKKYINKTLLEENGKTTLKNLGFGSILSNGVKDINEIKQTIAENYSNRINSKAEVLKEKKIKEGFAYAKNINTITLPDAAPGELRNNPIHQLKYFNDNIPKNTPNYYERFSATTTGEPVLDHIINIAKKDDNFDDLKDNPQNVLWDKGKLTLLADTKRDIKNLQYNPTLMFSVPIKSNDGKTQKTINMTVNINDPSYKDMYKTALFNYSNKLFEKQKNGSATGSDIIMANKLNKTLYNLSDYGNNFDLLDLNSLEQGKTVKFEFAPNQNIGIKGYDYNAPGDKSFYLTEYFRDKNGNIIKENGKEKEGFFALNKSTGKWELVEESALKNKNYEAIGANTPEDLKIHLANIFMQNFAK